ncbi:MAG TPA: hypothetical protein VGZ47_00870 [Gemmataceae bacterium]|jgi:hypothetical protein|nr:hypothetical protein [Gemmataceae bacterium]
MIDDDSTNYWPAQSLRAAVACFATGLVLFILLWMLQSSGADMRAHWLLGFVQKIGGKWAVAGICGALGAFFLVMALLGSSISEDDALRAGGALTPNPPVDRSETPNPPDDRSERAQDIDQNKPA